MTTPTPAETPEPTTHGRVLAHNVEIGQRVEIRGRMETIRSRQSYWDHREGVIRVQLWTEKGIVHSFYANHLLRTA